MGFFLYRTPKSGSAKEMTKTSYFQHLRNDRNSIVEMILGVSGIVFAWFVFIHGVWFLALSMLGFGVFTLKSMNLTRAITRRLNRPAGQPRGLRGSGPEMRFVSAASLYPLQIVRVYTSTVRY